MKRRWISWSLLVVLAAAGGFWSTPALAAKQGESVRAAEQIVQETLQREAEAGLPDRAAALRPALKLGQARLCAVAAGNDAVADSVAGPDRRFDAWKEACRNAAIEAAAREKAVAQYNLVAAELNSRVSSTLSEATGETKPATPEEWQNWRYYDNETEPVGETPLRYSYHREHYGQVSMVTGPPPTFHSCLAAGTLVWTEAGPVAVERVRAGDRVLACDPNSGVLELKPVLRATFNPDAPTFTLHIGNKKIEATSGHVFWVSGKGWVKARDLKDGMQLHTLQGTVELERVEPGKQQTMFNLVVADSHTFFAGEGQVLTHDVTIRKPTNCVVPGLSAAIPQTP